MQGQESREKKRKRTIDVMDFIEDDVLDIANCRQHKTVRSGSVVDRMRFDTGTYLGQRHDKA